MFKSSFEKSIPLLLIIFITASITYTMTNISNSNMNEKYNKLLLQSKLNEISVFLKDNSQNDTTQISFTNNFSYKLGELSSLYWNGANSDENIGTIIPVIEKIVINSNLDNTLSSSELINLSGLFGKLSKDVSNVNFSKEIIEVLKEYYKI